MQIQHLKNGKKVRESNIVRAIDWEKNVACCKWDEVILIVTMCVCVCFHITSTFMQYEDGAFISLSGWLRHGATNGHL